MEGAIKDVDRVKEAIKTSEVLPAEKRVLLLKVLSSLEGEIQARDVTLGVLKSECLKNLVSSCDPATESSPCDIKKDDITPSPTPGYLKDPSFALMRDSLYASSRNSVRPDSHDINFLRLQTSLNKHKFALKKSLLCLRESERRRDGCLKEIQVLKEEQQRLQSEEEKVVEDPKPELEKEEEKPDPKIESLENKLQEEQKQKMQMVSVLMNDRKQIAMKYLEEKNRTDILSRILKEEKKKSQKLALELEEESKRSLSIEAEMEMYLRQVSDLQEENKKNLIEEKRRSLDLEELLRRTKQEAEHLRKQLAEAHRVAMSQASVGVVVPPPPQANSGSSSGSQGKSSKLKTELPDMESNDFYSSLRQQQQRNPVATRGVGVKADMSVSPSSSSSSAGGSSGVTSGNQTVVKKPLKGIVPPPVPPNKPNIVRNYPVNPVGSNSHDTNVDQNSRKIRYINE